MTSGNLGLLLHLKRWRMLHLEGAAISMNSVEAGCQHNLFPDPQSIPRSTWVVRRAIMEICMAPHPVGKGHVYKSKNLPLKMPRVEWEL